MPLASPPERVALHELVHLKFRASTETLVKAERAAVFLEKSIDAR